MTLETEAQLEAEQVTHAFSHLLPRLSVGGREATARELLRISLLLMSAARGDNVPLACELLVAHLQFLAIKPARGTTTL